MIGPSVERDALLPVVGAAIINARHTCLVATDVVQYGLDNMRLYSDLGHVGCGRSAKIVQAPRRQRFAFGLSNARIEHELAVRPDGECAAASAEYQIPSFPA